MPTETPSPTPERAVRELRHASRLLVRALGLMQSRLKGIDCTPAQCHALLELEARGRITSVELAEVLQVDKSTASRTLAPLLRAGLVATRLNPGDQRSKPMVLTDAGRLRVEAIQVAADSQVRGALELLSEEERTTVLSGVSLYERALQRAKALKDVCIRPIDAADDPAIAAVIREVMSEFGAVGSGYSSADAEVDSMHSAYAADRSAYFVAERGGVVLAGGGIAPLVGSEQPEVCELRKMHALPAARGLGIGRLLLEQCLSTARELGFKVCYLETLRHLHRARALYEKFGFEPLSGPMGSTGHYACDNWYALDL